MATDINIQMQHNNGTDWDKLYPKTKSTIVTMNDGTTLESTIGGINTTLSSKVTQTDINNAISALVNGAPAALDTLKELADAINDDANYATTITNSLANKVDKVTGKGLSTNDFTTPLLNKLNAVMQLSIGSATPTDGSTLWYQTI